MSDKSAEHDAAGNLSYENLNKVKDFLRRDENLADLKAGYDTVARRLIGEFYTVPDFVYDKWKRVLDVADVELRSRILNALTEAHAAGRAEVLAEVMPVLEFATLAAEHLFGKAHPQANICPTFYHTLTYEGDCELVEKVKRARALIEKLKT